MIKFNEKDLRQLETLEISVDKVESQIESFKKGFTFTQIESPCFIEQGINIIPESEFENLINLSDKASLESRLIKFVPASGAASRMFKTLAYFNNNFEKITDTNIKILAEQGDKEANELYKFISSVKKFAFFDDLRIVMAKDGFDINSLITTGEYKEIIDYLLEEKGLNYSNLPKGLLKFHNYSNSEPRTPFEEHLVEAAIYTKDKNNQAKIHFTVSPEHLESVSNYLNKIKGIYEKKFKVNFKIEYSVQKTSTNTIAVDMNNQPFYDDNEILFRPAGHGALIQNLDDLKANIIFIKNIDNVIPDNIKAQTINYKKALAGFLINLQNKIFYFLKSIDSDNYNLEDIYNFTENELLLKIPQSIKNESKENQVTYLQSKLNRPIRVCGMVKNQGEAGGGPFWIISKNNQSMQIVESSQIDLKDGRQKDIFNQSTHFNPVDLVCGVKDYRGNNFNLEKYIDIETGFISNKSKDGKELKALELPGLWNGAMAYWNTIFIEVPLITFNPVKTVNDLLRDEHQVL